LEYANSALIEESFTNSQKELSEASSMFSRLGILSIFFADGYTLYLEVFPNTSKPGVAVDDWLDEV
jgi:hypothetical protein